MMDWPATCAAVIPCLNEDAAIGPLVTEVRLHLPIVFVVDDGSRDQTSERGKEAGATVLKQPASFGKGAALQIGWTLAKQRGFTWALSMDGDGQHAPQDIPQFLDCAQQTCASLVVGNRMGQAFQIPLVRRWVNRGMSWQLSKLTGRSLPDSQCGFRLMNLQDWGRLPITASHFEIESEVLFQFASAQLRIEFVPIRVIYKHEQSKIHPMRDTLRWLRWRRQTVRRIGQSINQE